MKYVGEPKDLMEDAYEPDQRPRTEGLYGVTEVLHCHRMVFILRKMPSPPELDFETRSKFSRGHAFERAFFGRNYNPTHEVNEGLGIEGHTDTVIETPEGKVLCEFKSTRRVFWGHPDCEKKYPSEAQAKKHLEREDVEPMPSEHYVDQLRAYMALTGAVKGRLIVHDLSTDKIFEWQLDSAEADGILETLKEKKDQLQHCVEGNVSPRRNPCYDWECDYCHPEVKACCDNPQKMRELLEKNNKSPSMVRGD